MTSDEHEATRNVGSRFKAIADAAHLHRAQLRPCRRADQWRLPGMDDASIHQSSEFRAVRRAIRVLVAGPLANLVAGRSSSVPRQLAARWPSAQNGNHSVALYGYSCADFLGLLGIVLFKLPVVTTTSRYANEVTQ